MFSQLKKFIDYTSMATLWQKNTFVVEVIFKVNINLQILPIVSRSKRKVKLQPGKSDMLLFKQK